MAFLENLNFMLLHREEALCFIVFPDWMHRTYATEHIKLGHALNQTKFCFDIKGLKIVQLKHGECCAMQKLYPDFLFQFSVNIYYRHFIPYEILIYCFRIFSFSFSRKLLFFILSIVANSNSCSSISIFYLIHWSFVEETMQGRKLHCKPSL